jgi:hypothetical protein
VPTAPREARNATEVLELATQLERNGHFREAAQVLERLPRDDRDPLVDVRIVQLRHLAFVELADEPPARARRDASLVDPFPGSVGAPEVHASELTAELLAAAVHHHGCIIVRGLLDADECAQLRSDIDHAFATFDDHGPHKPVEMTAPWYARFSVEGGFELPDPLGTAFLRSAGGVYGPFAPRAFVEYRNALADAGLLDVVHEHLGAMPVLSVNKFVLRRISGGAEPAWHQDGGYLGVDTNAVNLWVALSDCGADTDKMGLDIIPGPRHELAEIGTHDAIDERAISQFVAEELASKSGRPIYRPFFGVGDGILFDQFFIHRSDPRPLEVERYAIESWFFTAADYPRHLIPVVAG